jgi:hypothetical protein
MKNINVEKGVNLFLDDSFVIEATKDVVYLYERAMIGFRAVKIDIKTRTVTVCDSWKVKRESIPEDER